MDSEIGCTDEGAKDLFDWGSMKSCDICKIMPEDVIIKNSKTCPVGRECFPCDGSDKVFLKWRKKDGVVFVAEITHYCSICGMDLKNSLRNSVKVGDFKSDDVCEDCNMQIEHKINELQLS